MNYARKEIGTGQLVLHCGGQNVSLEQVEECATPEPTRTHYPIPHALLVRHVMEHFRDRGLEIVDEAHSLSHEGARYFGLYELRPTNAEHGTVVGLRNTHDLSYSASMVMGARVFVCDNLGFSGEVRMSRKHTRFIRDDLKRLVNECTGKLITARMSQEERFRQYKAAELTDSQAHDCIIDALDAKVIGGTHIPQVLKEWREPSFDFGFKTGWRLYNAFTNGMKDLAPATVLKKTLPLNGVVDKACLVDLSRVSQHDLRAALAN